MDAQTKIKIQEVIRENHEWHQAHDDHDGYKGSELEAKNLAALSATEQPEAQVDDMTPYAYDVPMEDGQSRELAYTEWYRSHGKLPEGAIPLYSADQITALKQEKAGSAKDTQRLDFICQFGQAWSVAWSKKGKGPVTYRMIEDGEFWGKKYPTAREAIDAAISAQKGQP